MLGRFLVLATLALAASFGLSEPSASDQVSRSRPLAQDQFSDGSWELRIDRVWHPAGGRIPTSLELPDADFRLVSNGPRYSVVVSDHGRSISILEQGANKPRVTGTRRTSGERVSFELEEGLFAGGRLSVWASASALEAEFLIYGSGVLLVAGERGALSRKP